MVTYYFVFTCIILYLLVNNRDQNVKSFYLIHKENQVERLYILVFII